MHFQYVSDEGPNDREEEIADDGDKVEGISDVSDFANNNQYLQQYLASRSASFLSRHPTLRKNVLYS
jgi:hypothetical protein